MAKMKQGGPGPLGTSRADAKLGCAAQPGQGIAESVCSLPLPSAGPSNFDGSTQKRSSGADQIFHLDMWFVRMRWIACAVSGTLIALSVWVLGYLEAEVFWPLAIVVAGLLASNVLFHQCVRRKWFAQYLNEIQICSDLVFLTALLHFSGGIENPATLTYVFHVIISGILLDKRKCYTTVVVASILFGAMAFAEMAGLLEHYTPGVFPHPQGEHGLLHAAHQPLYVAIVVMFQAVLMSLAAYFITTIMDRLRAEEGRTMAEHQRLLRVLQATGAGFLILDKQLHPVWLNDQAKKWLRLLRKSSRRGPNSSDQYAVGGHAPSAETFRDGKIRVVEQQAVDPQGDKRFFEVTSAPLTDESGRVYQVVELSQDITERKRLEKELLSIIERERRRIGQELHDSIGQQLTGIEFMTEVLEQKLNSKSLTEASYAAKITSLVSQTTDQARKLAKGLDPLDLDASNLLPALEALAATTEHLFGLSCRFRCDKHVPINDTSLATNLYRIAQEAITNAIRHGKAKNILIELVSKAHESILTVKSDGLDFPEVQAENKGMGLKIMNYRAAIIDGSLDIHKGAHGGTIVACVFPNRTANHSGGKDRGSGRTPG